MHPDILILKVNLAGLYQQMEVKDRVEPLLLECLDAQTNTLGKERNTHTKKTT